MGITPDAGPDYAGEFGNFADYDWRLRPSQLRTDANPSALKLDLTVGASDFAPSCVLVIARITSRGESENIVRIIVDIKVGLVSLLGTLRVHRAVFNTKECKMDYDEKYQDHKNGPLSKSLRARLSAFRSFSTLADIGKSIGFSGAFVSQILNEAHPARVDSKHIARIVRAVEDGEAKYAKKLGLTKPEHQNGAVAPAVEEKKTLDYHLNAIDSLGWKIMGLERKAS
jgi:hypothetical protein